MANAVQTGKERCPACKTDNVVLKDVNGLLVCDRCSQKRFSAKVREKIQEAYDRQQEQKRREIWRKRIEIVKRGIDYYEEKKILNAIKIFHEYLAILEAHYRVPSGGLHPALFKKKELDEILIICGVYWDLAKAYDQVKGKRTAVVSSLNKFVEFSVNRPHVLLASEAMRKYINSGVVKHRDDFKHSHEILRSQLAKCFIASAVYGPTSFEVRTLQQFRDQVLSKSKFGQILIQIYYRVSPPIARLLLRYPGAVKPVRVVLNKIVQWTSFTE